MMKERLEVLDPCGRLSNVYPKHGLPFAEAVILQKSMEFFDDPEPCFIHRGAVMVRLTEEIWDFFRRKMEAGQPQIFSQELPDTIRRSLPAVPEDAVLRVVRD